MFSSAFFRALALLLITGLTAPPARSGEDWLGKIRVPPGFHISLYTDGIPNARSMTLGDDGTVYVGSLQAGKVYAVRDANRDGTADRVDVIASGLNVPNGVAFFQGDLYIAEIERIVKLAKISGRLESPPLPTVVADGYPSETHHGWKYLRIGPDAKLYVPVGAPCNICLPDNDIFATITRLDLDGKNREIFARGIRNTVGFDWHPETRQLWFTDNGRDWLGDDRPPDELNTAAQAGLHFGYPYCHGGDIPDPEFGAKRPCSDFVPPAWKFPAHVAALGMRFYTGQQFPAEFRQQLFVAQHGSWNRTQPQGYRVVVVSFDQGKPVGERVFADGWLRADGSSLGRPVDVLELPDGSLLISDDQRGVLYRVTYHS
jgi:glucose/arabinose dehydrogenase